MLCYNNKLSMAFRVASLATHDRPYFFSAVDPSSDSLCAYEAAIEPIYPESDRKNRDRIRKQPI